MAVLFAETWSGADSSSAWPAPWVNASSNGSLAVASGEGQATAGLSNSAGYASAYRPLTAADQDITVEFTPRTAIVAVDQVWVAARATGSGTSLPVAGYLLSYNAAGTVTFVRRLAGATAFQIGSATFPAWVVGQTMRLRVRTVGVWVSAKVWKATDPEPAAWTFTGTDTGITTSGAVWLMAYSNSSLDHRVGWDNLTVTDGVTDVALPFVETFVLPDGEWPPPWQINTNSGSGTNGQIVGGAGYYRATGSSSQAAAAYLAGMPATLDTDVVADVNMASGISTAYGAQLTISARGDARRAGFSTPATCYAVELRNTQTYAVLYKYVSGVATEIARPEIGAWAIGVARRVRFQATGSTIRVKVWAPASAEPAAWAGSYTDTTITAAGRVAIGMLTTPNASTTTVVLVDNIGVTDLGIANGSLDVPATVDVQLYGANGTLELPSTVAVEFTGVGSTPGTLDLPVAVGVLFSGSNALLDLPIGVAVLFAGTGTAYRTLELPLAVAVQFDGMFLPDDVPTLNPTNTPHLAIEVFADLTRTTFVLDRDELDGEALLGWPDDDERGWSNVVCDVLEAHVRRGATRSQGVLTRAEAGTCEMQLVDHERAFDPFLEPGEGVYANTRIRVRAWQIEPDGSRWSEVVFTGTIDSLEVNYTQNGPGLVSVSASDLVGQLAGTELTSLAGAVAGFGDTLRDRAMRVLEAAGHPGAGPFEYGMSATLAPVELKGAAWDLLTAAADAELGAVWVDRLNRPRISGRRSDPPGPTRGTLSDSHEELVAGEVHCCYRDPVGTVAMETLTNRASVTRRAWEQPTTVRVQPAPVVTIVPAPATPANPVVEAAQAILARLDSGAAIFEDLTWPGCPTVVSEHNDELTGVLGGLPGADWRSLAADRLRAYLAQQQTVPATTTTVTYPPEVTVTLDPPVPGSYRGDNTGSQRRFGVRALTDGAKTLELLRDTQLRPWVRALLRAESEPEVRIGAVTPAPDAYPEAWPAVIRTDIGDRWAFRLRLPTGDPVDRTLAVLGVQHDITPAGWVVSWQTARTTFVDPYTLDGWFTLGFSDLDGPDELAPYTGQPWTWEDGWGDVDGGSPSDPRDGLTFDGGGPRAEQYEAPLEGGAP